MSNAMTLHAHTDCVIRKLGDVRGVCAPIRECTITGYSPPYVTIAIAGITTRIRSRYVYTRPGRFGDVPEVPVEDLEKMENVK